MGSDITDLVVSEDVSSSDSEKSLGRKVLDAGGRAAKAVGLSVLYLIPGSLAFAQAYGSRRLNERNEFVESANSGTIKENMYHPGTAFSADLVFGSMIYLSIPAVQQSIAEPNIENISVAAVSVAMGLFFQTVKAHFYIDAIKEGDECKKEVEYLKAYTSSSA